QRGEGSKRALPLSSRLRGGTLHPGSQRVEVVMSPPSARLRWWYVGLGAVCVAALAGALLYAYRSRIDATAPPPAHRPQAKTADIAEQVHNFCGGACHAYPPPDTFPRWAWKQEVERGFRFFEKSGRSLKAPPISEVVRYYEQRAPA